MMKTTVFAKSGSVRGDWFVVDASDKTLGRLATQIAHRLKGKHKAIYSPHVDMGDHIVVLNAEKIHVTGRKLTDKIYYHHTGYIGGIKSIALEKLLKEHPERVIEIAVQMPVHGAGPPTQPPQLDGRGQKRVIGLGCEAIPDRHRDGTLLHRHRQLRQRQRI